MGFIKLTANFKNKTTRSAPEYITDGSLILVFRRNSVLPKLPFRRVTEKSNALDEVL